MVAERTQRAPNDRRDAFDRRLIPQPADDRLFGVVQPDRRRGNAAEREAYRKKLEKEYARFVFSHMLHAVHALNDARAWDMLCIGSDNDGLINPFDFDINANDETGLEDSGVLLDHMLNILRNPNYLSDLDDGRLVVYEDGEERPLTFVEWQPLMFGLSPQDVVEKISYRNVDAFLAKYFHAGYLT